MPETQQRMLRRGPGVFQRLRGAAQPVRLPLPRIGRQPVRAPWPGECLPTPDVASRGMGARRREQHRVSRCRTARQGRQHPARGIRRRQRVVQVGLQHRLRPDFYKDADARRDQAPCGLGESHRGTHVAPPVLGVQGRSIRRAARHRGHVGQRRRIRRQARQLPRQRAFDRVHRRAVEGVVQVQQRERPACRLRLLAQRQQRRLRPGDRRGAAAVLRCDLDAGAGQRLGGCVGAQADHRHAPGARRLRLQAAAHRNHAAGLVQGQRPGCPGRGDLTDAVAHARIRLHARGPQRHDQRHLDREQQGLRDRGVPHCLCVRRRQPSRHRPAQRSPERGIRGIQRRTERRAASHRIRRHARPLAAVAREHECDASADRRIRRHGMGRLACQVGPQPGPQFRRGGARGGQAQLVLVSRHSRAADQRGVGFTVRQQVAPLGRQGAQRTLAPGR